MEGGAEGATAGERGLWKCKGVGKNQGAGPDRRLEDSGCGAIAERSGKPGVRIGRTRVRLRDFQASRSPHPLPLQGLGQPSMGGARSGA